MEGLLFSLFLGAIWYGIISKRKDSPKAANPAAVISNEEDTRIPKHVSCQHCNSRVELDDRERMSGRFICPRCHSMNVVSQLSFDSDEHKRETTFQLLPVACCPKCNADLELDNQERENGELVCPECRRRSAVGEGTPIRQYWFSKNPICPECAHENGLTDTERGRPSFVCAGCHETIVFVED